MVSPKEILGKLVMVALPIILILSLVVMVIKLAEKGPEVAPGPGGAQVSPTPTSLSPTRWSTDSGVLEVEKEISRLEKNLEEVDLKQAPLYPPVLDMEVEF